MNNMLREQSLFNTFLTQTSNLLPSWLSASITSPTTTYSQYDYHASILQYIDAKAHPGCNQLTIENNGLLYVLRTRNSLSLNIAGQAKSLIRPNCLHCALQLMFAVVVNRHSKLF